MGIFSFLFGKNKSSINLPFNGIVRFERKKSSYELIIGEEVNLWSKPNSNQINLYKIGSVGGDGLIGTVTNSSIYYHLENTDDLFVENEIVGLSSTFIDLKINMFVDKKAVEEMQQSAVEEWVNKISSKYNPKTNWSIRFYSENKIDKNKIVIRNIKKEELKNYYNKSNQLIWLENLEGEKIDAENHILLADTIKTLRAIYSGHQIEVKSISKDRNYYTLEIGKKEIDKQ